VSSLNPGGPHTAGGLVLLVALDELHFFFFFDTNAKRGNIDTLD
jgi:hypothetical protein